MRDSIDTLSKLLQYDIESYLQSFSTFSQSPADTIFAYYESETDVIPQEISSHLDYLLDQQAELKELLILKSDQVDAEDLNRLLALLDDTFVALDTAKNAGWWSGSNRTTLYRFGRPTQQVLGQNISADDVFRNEVSDGILNRLAEDDYDLEGGQVISLPLEEQGVEDLTSTAGPITHENLAGKDLNAAVLIVDNDFDVLDYDDTLLQSAKILLNLRQGQSQENAGDGIQTSLIGSSMGVMSTPLIIRQLLDTFATDDSFTNVTISDVQQQGDAMFYTVHIRNLGGEVLQSTLIL